MRFPQTYGYGGFGSWIDFFRGTRSEINYAAEVGDIQKLRQSSLVMTAVNWVGRRFPEAPVGVFDIDKDGKATEVLGHPITKALKRPNPFYSGKTMAKAIGLNWIISGNVYWRVFANSAGEPLAIWPIPFWMMEPRWDSPTQFIGWYDYIVDGTPIPLDVEEVIHFRDGIDPWNSRKGMSPLGALLREIYTDNEIGNFSAALMTNSGIPEFMLIPKEGATGMTSEERKFLKEEFDAMRSGANRGKAILATKGLEVQPLTFEPKKLDLTVLRDIPESRLASVIGIPASALGLNIGIKNNTYTNAKELGEDATEGYLVPLWDYFSEELTFYFQERGVLKENQEIRYKKNEVRALQEDKTDQFKRNSIAFQAGWMKRSEARVDANLPVDETIDDVYITDIKAEQQKVQAEMLADRVNKDGDPLMKYLMDGTPTDEEKVAMRESWIARVPREARGLYRSNGHAQT
jgi:HK97 family phage portal protein